MRDDKKTKNQLMEEMRGLRKQIAELRSMNARLAAAFDVSPAAAFMIDRGHNVVLWNRACAALTKISKEEALASRLDLSRFYKKESEPILAELILEMDEKELLRKYGQAGGVRKDELRDGSYKHTHRIGERGSERLWAVQATLLRNDAGEVEGAIQSLQDVSELERLEKQLRQVQKMEAIGMLAGGIAHDFNNILTILIGYSEMVLRKIPDADSPLRGYLIHMLQAGNRAQDLVAQILAFSRRTEQERKPVEMSPIIKEALKLLRASLPANIQIKADIREDCGLVLADPIQLHQVLMNLCVNASHAMGDRGGVLKVEVRDVRIGPGDAAIHPDFHFSSYLRLTVSDTGHGMSPEIMERIFDPFFTTKEPGKGTGIGLAVIHGIVKSYNGVVTVESEVGKGTIFRVFLPRVKKCEGVQSEGFALIPAGTERILLVGNTEELSGMGKTGLEQLGYSVAYRAGSAEALETFRAYADEFDIVVAGKNMPDMKGMEFAEAIRNIRPEVPVILCAGSEETTSENYEKFARMPEIVSKPVSLRKLARSIRKVLDRQGW